MLIVTSAVTIAEVIKLPASADPGDAQSKLIVEYFENPYIVIRQVDRATAVFAHELCRKHALIHLDAIHLATALLANVGVLYTYDSKKNRRKGLLRWHARLGAPPLRIEQPVAPPPPPPLPPPERTLFDAEPDEGAGADTQHEVASAEGGPKRLAAPPEYSDGGGNGP